METYGKAERFIEIFNELETYMEKLLLKRPELIPSSYQGNYMSYRKKIELLSQKKIIQSGFLQELINYGELRNAIIHNYGSGDQREEKIIAQPLISEVENFEKLSRIIMSPPKVYNENMVIKRESMYFASITNKVTQVISRMNKEKYSYVPILQDDKLQGVFSHETLFVFVAEHKSFQLDENLKLDEFRELLDINNHSSERFEFMPKSSSVLDVDQKFKEDFNQEKRLEVIFITENGHRNEKILGLITIWDLANYKAKTNNMF